MNQAITDDDSVAIEPEQSDWAEDYLTQLVEQLRARDEAIAASRRDVERALAALRMTADTWEAIRLSHVPLRLLAGIWRRLISDGYLDTSNGSLELTAAGQELVSNLGVAPAREAHCRFCDGRGTDRYALPMDAAQRFGVICHDRPAPVHDYDQAYVTQATTLARVTFAWQRGDLEGRQILLLGDDDLVGVAAALTGLPARVVVAEIDERLIEFINHVARSKGLNMLEAVHYDLRNPLPDTWLRAFDTFFTDPTESLPGMKVTLERGLLSLRGRGSAGYFGLTHVESSPAKWAHIQSFLLERSTVVTDIRDDFSAYVNWGYMQEMRSWSWLPTDHLPKQPWYYSALNRIEALRKPIITNRRLTRDIYHDDESATM